MKELRQTICRLENLLKEMSLMLKTVAIAMILLGLLVGFTVGVFLFE